MLLDSLKGFLKKRNELSLFNDKIQQAYNTKWVVHCEPALAGAEHVVKYLGQVEKVTFVAKDYRDGAVKKPVTLDGVEFLRRFTCMCCLPGS